MPFWGGGDIAGKLLTDDHDRGNRSAAEIALRQIMPRWTAQAGAFSLPWLRSERAGLEAHETRDEGERDVAGSAVSVLCEDEVGFTFVFLFILCALGIIGLSLEKADHVGVLLD